MVSKKDIRKEVLSRRDAISEQEHNEKSKRIQNSVLTHPFYKASDAIYCYVNYRSEVETRSIIEQAWKDGKKVAVPRICGNDMEFFFIEHFDDLQDGYAHILEPKGQIIADAKQPLVIMPGSVFDANRNRIGYGKGFYDRYLQKHPNYRTLALAFEVQIVESVPADAFDICPEEIITEEHIYV